MLMLGDQIVRAVVDAVVALGDGVVVLGAGLGGDDRCDLVQQRGVPGGGEADGLGKHRGVAGARRAVEAFIPVVILGDAEARDGGGMVLHLGDLLFEGHL